MSDNSWPGVRLKDSPASDSFTRSDISRSAHIYRVTVQAQSNKRGESTQQVTFGHVHSVQFLQCYCVLCQVAVTEIHMKLHGNAMRIKN